MAASFHQQNYRTWRRIAAVSFLTNVSLDANCRGFYKSNSLKEKDGRSSTEEARRPLADIDCRVRGPSGKNETTDSEFAVSPRSIDSKSSRNEVDVGNECLSLVENTSREITPRGGGGRVMRLISESSASTHSSGHVRFIPQPRKLRNQRMILLSYGTAPYLVFSCVPFSKAKTQERKRKEEVTRTTSGSRPLIEVSEIALKPLEKIEEDISFSEYLLPSSRRFRKFHSAEETADLVESGIPHSITYQRATSLDPRLLSSSPIKDAESTEMCYDPNLLDNPDVGVGKHRTLLSFTSYRTTIIDYTKPSDVKKEINEQFRQKFPHIQLTLTKLRSLKREIKLIASKNGVDLGIIAQAYVYFEKLVLKGLVIKMNRKPCAAVSLLLASKMNDVKGNDLAQLLMAIADQFRIEKHDILSYEFPVVVALEFGLLLPSEESIPHYQRLKAYES